MSNNTKIRVGNKVKITSCPLKSYVDKEGEVMQHRPSSFFANTKEFLVYVIGKTSIWVFDSQLEKVTK